MKRNTIATTIAFSFLAVPFFAHAQSVPTVPRDELAVTITTSSGQVTEAQIFTACSQAAIEIRDSSISSSRTTYNNTMAIALNARKEAEKKAVAMEDADDKKSAIKIAVEDYKKAVTQAQDALTKARKEAWAQFETNTNDCRDSSKELHTTSLTEKKEEVTQMRADTRAVQANTSTTNIKEESVSFKEGFMAKLESIKNFFRKSE